MGSQDAILGEEKAVGADEPLGSSGASAREGDESGVVSVEFGWRAVGRECFPALGEGHSDRKKKFAKGKS